ncbi:hypothetical protein EDD41_2732 [Luteococcus japonicus]|uniref:Uncharacterized protein n=1 Tax=Luteococcus japonicus TaxID=33984 RepID=A0A3N1ZXK6_9ACTN|nr:hypothetical protein [Luteococcus japonicus]ROR55458.1 hypothetical protein EDD41_2732 [Luteococcus japonicus]
MSEYLLTQALAEAFRHQPRSTYGTSAEGFRRWLRERGLTVPAESAEAMLERRPKPQGLGPRTLERVLVAAYVRDAMMLNGGSQNARQNRNRHHARTFQGWLEFRGYQTTLDQAEQMLQGAFWEFPGGLRQAPLFEDSEPPAGTVQLR